MFTKFSNTPTYTDFIFFGRSFKTEIYRYLNYFSVSSIKKVAAVFV